MAVELGKELARRIGVPFESVGYGGSAPFVKAATAGQWDVAFLAIDPARNGVMDFAPPYMEIEAGYLVPAGSSRNASVDVDRPGVPIYV